MGRGLRPRKDLADPALAISPARDAAYRILRRVEAGSAFAVDLLQGAPAAGLRDADRRLATELAMGVLRWRGELDYQLEQLSGRSLSYFDPEVAVILRLGIYQIRFLEKVPKSAAVNESVELTRAARKQSAAGLVNAVLRRCNPPPWEGLEARHEGAPDPELDAAALRSLPAWLRKRWTARLGVEKTVALARASASTPRVSLRVRAERRDEVRRELAAENVATRLGAYSDSALIVESGRVQASTAFREGRLAIQDEASQIVASLVRPLPGESVLDLCAAPGNKTAQLAAALGRGQLVACDVSLRRLQTMRRLLAGQLPAATQFLTVCQDATQPLAVRGTFDRILVDAPCSGTGTLARNPEIKLRLQPSDLDRLAGVQVRMLRTALEALAGAGRLVYATCSLEPEENEEVIERACAEEPGFRPLKGDELAREFPALAPLFDPQGYFRTRPDRDGMDGFFAAVITRRRN